MFYPACGAKNPEGASYCVCCGKPLPNTGGGISAETVGHQTHALVTIEGPSTSSGVLASSPEGIKSFLFFPLACVAAILVAVALAMLPTGPQV